MATYSKPSLMIQTVLLASSLGEIDAISATHFYVVDSSVEETDLVKEDHDT
jgi:hypothetical protein